MSSSSDSFAVGLLCEMPLSLQPGLLGLPQNGLLGALLHLQTAMLISRSIGACRHFVSSAADSLAVPRLTVVARLDCSILAACCLICSSAAIMFGEL